MELRQLNTFRSVARELNFTRAAEALSYAQSSVTAQVQSLEEELGVPLFERLGKRVTLTEAGRRLLSYADRILHLADEARAAVPHVQEPAGTLIIGAAESLCAYRLPPVLALLRERYPQVRVIFRPDCTLNLARSLGDGQLDLAFILQEPSDPEHLVVEQLLPEEMVLLAYPRHPLAALDEVVAQDLAGQTLLKTEAGCCYRLQLERMLAEAEVQADTSMEFASVEAIKQCVIAGMGISLLPRVTVAAELEQGQLVALPWAGPRFRVVTHVAWHKDKWVSPAMRAFLEVTREGLGN